MAKQYLSVSLKLINMTGAKLDDFNAAFGNHVEGTPTIRYQEGLKGENGKPSRKHTATRVPKNSSYKLGAPPSSSKLLPKYQAIQKRAQLLPTSAAGHFPAKMAKQWLVTEKQAKNLSGASPVITALRRCGALRIVTE